MLIPMVSKFERERERKRKRELANGVHQLPSPNTGTKRLPRVRCSGEVDGENHGEAGSSVLVLGAVQGRRVACDINTVCGFVCLCEA